MISGVNSDFETILPTLLKKELLQNKLKDIIDKEEYRRFLLGKNEEKKEENVDYIGEKIRKSIFVLSAVILYRRFYSVFLKFLNSGFSKEFSFQSATNCSMIENIADLEVFLEDIILLSRGKTVFPIGLDDQEWKGLESLKNILQAQAWGETREEEEEFEEELEDYEYVPATLGGEIVREEKVMISETERELLMKFIESAIKQTKTEIEEFYELVERKDFVLQLLNAHLSLGSFIYNGRINKNRENVLLVFYKKSIFKGYLE